jgi:hypothetical protein
MHLVRLEVRAEYEVGIFLALVTALAVFELSCGLNLRTVGADN